jgi:Uma2 family endonuclease
MAATAPRVATYEDLAALPENVIGEIIHGALITQPRPASPHARAATTITGDLTGPFDRGRGGPGGWLILFEPELHLDRHVLVPDIAGWRRTRMPEMPDVAGFTLAPDWICEVISPGTAKVDRADKMPLYASFGVGHAWLVDPLARMLEAFELVDGRWTLMSVHGDDAVARIAPFDAIELALADLWRR